MRLIINKESHGLKAYNTDYIESVKLIELVLEKYAVVIEYKSGYDYVLENADKQQATELFDRIIQFLTNSSDSDDYLNIG